MGKMDLVSHYTPLTFGIFGSECYITANVNQTHQTSFSVTIGSAPQSARARAAVRSLGSLKSVGGAAEAAAEFEVNSRLGKELQWNFHRTLSQNKTEGERREKASSY